MHFEYFPFYNNKDPNIDETGRQRLKSNNGPNECCYNYCNYNDGLCSSSCDTIFRSNQTAIASTTNHPNQNQTQTSQQSFLNQTPNLFIKLDDGTYILNDYSHMPDAIDMSCPVLPNITQSTQHCLISQAQVSSRSSATSLIIPTSLISKLIQLLTSFSTHLVYQLMSDNYSINCIVALLHKFCEYHWTKLVWNLLQFTALSNILLQLVIGS